MSLSRDSAKRCSLASSSLLLNLEILSTTSDETGSSGGHETSLLTAGSVSGDG